MPREDFACADHRRVRWVEVDMQKIVFNGHYLTCVRGFENTAPAQ